LFEQSATKPFVEVWIVGHESLMTCKGIITLDM